ncbi:DUF5134 domain-containing protein [Streptomyces kunmingensis]|uniref:DUF5134 domain-containing protein n=1 Tax=Streptomyces kunmingensis TaxID=68225 RepID=A0ABU6CLZ4_9ACTN|nr:DUF5134 domain-containing protein [Streptomyces kunmingensis]MEB3965741.1 DUF5134 domain-containing protein [Streptomyces kunmingensis]
MINAIGLRWILTALFVLPTLYALWLTAAPGRAPADRVGHALHAVMGVAMAAMVWPRGMNLPAGPQVVVFSAGALWFAAAALARSSHVNTRTTAVIAALPHIVMMAAMAWMAAVMNGSAMAAGGGGAGHDMPGMDMSGTDATSAMTLSQAADQWTAGLLAVALVALGLRRLAQAFDQGRVAVRPAMHGTTVLVGGGEASEAACHAAMAVGMGVMFVLLV